MDDGLGLNTAAEEVEDTLSVEWEWEKLVLGLATYGRTFTLRDWHGSGVGTAALWDKTRSFCDIKNSLSHERASERVSVAEGASEASSPEQANE